MISIFSKKTFCALLVEFLLVIIVIISPALMCFIDFILPDPTANYIIKQKLPVLPFFILEILSFLTFFALCLKLLLDDKLSLIKIPAITLGLFLFFAIMQLVPLPQDLLQLFSPNTASLFKNFGFDSVNKFTLSIYPEAGIGMLLQLLSFLAIFFVVLNYIDTQVKCKRLIWVIIVVGSAYALYGIAHKLITSPYAHNPTFSTFTYRSNFAAYVGMIIPLAIGYSLITLSKTKKVALLFMAAVMLVALFFTTSRAARIIYPAGLFVFFVILKLRNPKKRNLVFAFVLVSVSIFLAALIGFSPLLQRMESLKSPVDSYSHRFQVVKEGINIFKDFPVFGTGLGTYWEIERKYTLSDWKQYPFVYNEPLQLLLEAGLVGALLLFSFFFILFRRIFSLLSKRNNQYVIYMTFACLISLFSIIFHSALDWVFHLPANAFLFFIILALAFRLTYLKKDPDDSIISKFDFFLSGYLKLSIVVFLGFMLFLLGSLAYRRYQADSIFLKVENRITKSLSKDAAALELLRIDRALELNPLNSSYWDKKAEILRLLAAKKSAPGKLFVESDSFAPDESLLLARKCYKQAIGLNPSNVKLHFKLGQLYELLSWKDEMKEEFRKALLLGPKNSEMTLFIKKHCPEIEE